MLSAIGSGLTTVIGFVGSVVTALVSDTGSLHDLMDLFILGIIISIIMVSMKIIRRVTWGS